MSDTLTNFDSEAMFEELLRTRMLTLIGGKYYFKYAFFFSFFLGRYITQRPAVLADFVDKPEHYRIEGLLEVIAGLGNDNTALVTRLADRLDGYLDEFTGKYLSEDFDPLKNAIWPVSRDHDDRLWLGITKQIEEGPVGAEQLDVIKSSPGSESRTADQTVRYEELHELEALLLRTRSFLAEALKASDDISGALKKRAVTGLFGVYLTIFQIAVILSPRIARNRSTIWGPIRFLNTDEPFEPASDEETARAVTQVITNAQIAIARICADLIGTKKLGEVFKALCADEAKSGYHRVLEFACVLSSKPKQWDIALEAIIESTDKNAFFLFGILQLLMFNFKEDVNHVRDREAIKRLVALIYTKRSLGRNSPGAKPVSRMLKQLEQRNAFASSPPEEESE